jgi:glucose dehydrogenase
MTQHSRSALTLALLTGVLLGTGAVASGDGKIFLQQADTTLVALDAQTGKVIWSEKNGNPRIGETNTNAPHVALT